MSAEPTTQALSEPSIAAILTLPRLRVQNANAISSPLTWGFPAITAFTGLMTALERRLGPAAGIRFLKVGVVCHQFEPQVSRSGYTNSFRLTRNPVDKDGNTAAIVEEGRVHLDITLVFEVVVAPELISAEAGTALAQEVHHTLQGLRVAGGSLLPASGRVAARWRPALERVQPEGEALDKQFRALARRCLPGFALVLRNDLLADKLATLQQADPKATALDAWLSLSRLTYRAPGSEPPPAGASKLEWQPEARPGWLVPIPVGFAALSALHPAGSVKGARDATVPFRFVETLWSIGQWISPHRLRTLHDLFWYPDDGDDGNAALNGVYRCTNRFKAADAAELNPIFN